MKFLIGVTFCVISFAAAGQSITISGRVQDKATHEALPFASVGVKDKNISTVTNLNGEFDFHLPEEYRNEILVISMLGYTNFEAPVWSLSSPGGQVQDILMDKSPTILDEVLVTDSLSGGDIMRISVGRIEKNFPTQPFILDGFYRDIKKVGGTYFSLLEAAVQVYDETYEEPRNKSRLKERVRLVEVRQSLGYENKFTNFFDQDNLLEDLLLHNSVRYRQFGDNDEFYLALKREKDSYYNGHPIFVVSHKEMEKFKVFIDKVDYSIIHLEYEIGFQDQVMAKKKDLKSKFGGLKKTLDFKRFGDKMYLNYMTMSTKVNWYDNKTNTLKFETELQQELLVNAVHPNTPLRIGSTEKMRNYGLQYQDQPYNKKFWENYNVIKETPINKKILNDLEKHLPLEEQFQN